MTQGFGILKTMSYKEYIQNDYRADLMSLYKRINREDPPGADGMFINLNLCPHVKRGYFRHLRDSEKFKAVLYIEALTQALVHYHDNANYQEYIRIRGGPEIFMSGYCSTAHSQPAQFVGWMTIRSERDREDLIQNIKTASKELLPLWFKQYQMHFGRGAAQHLRGAIQRDLDVRYVQVS